VYNWLISLLPPIVLDNLFGQIEPFALKKGKTIEAFKKHFRTNVKLDFGISKKQSSHILKLFS